MSAISKIERYRLGNRVIKLDGKGKTATQIAEILTKELKGKDSITQTAVSRWLKSFRDPSQSTRDIAELKRLALDMIRILNAFVRTC